MKSKVKQENWYSFNHKAINKKFTGGLTFCNYFCVNDEYSAVAVYKVKTPDSSKGHKKYLLLGLMTRESDGAKIGVVRGMSAQKMKQFRYQHAIHCLSCDTILYSINRHHYHGCGCENETHVDGGAEYLRYLGKDLKKIKIITLDLLTNKIVQTKGKK